MSIHRSYFSRNNTIIYNSYTNTGRNPIVSLNFGSSNNGFSPLGYTRFIFDLNLEQLREKISSGIISTGCTNNLVHRLNMTNAIKFDEDLLNTYNSNQKLRATSFDLILFRIPERLECSGPITTTTTTIPTTTTTTTFPVTTTTTTIPLPSLTPNPCDLPTPTPTPQPCLYYEVTNIYPNINVPVTYTDCSNNQVVYTLSGGEVYNFCGLRNSIVSVLTPVEIDNCLPPVPTPTVYPTTTTTTTCVVVGCQRWDEGVGYDYYDLQLTQNTGSGVLSAYYPQMDKSFSERPSNWYQSTTIDFWSEPGIYNNKNNGLVNYNDLTIIDIQHFEFGNEDINFDMTSEINGVLDGTIPCTGWGIAYRPEFELITGITSSYSVSFFSRHTQTFYEPFLQTTYDDLVEDDRNIFVEHSENKLYLYVNIGGDLVNLDSPPVVTIKDNNGDTIQTSTSSCLRTRGVYEIDLPPFSGFTVPCNFTDSWSNLFYNGVPLKDVENEFIILPYENKFQIGSQSKEPELYGFDFYGLKQDEKILNTEIRKVGVVIKKAYTPLHLLNTIQSYYRVYVKEGQTEVQVQDWTKINRTPNEYYFMFDTRDKLPNEYYIDIKVNTSGEVDIYKKQIKFQIVNRK
jgi:hypothetical protein